MEKHSTNPLTRIEKQKDAKATKTQIDRFNIFFALFAIFCK